MCILCDFVTGFPAKMNSVLHRQKSVLYYSVRGRTAAGACAYRGRRRRTAAGVLACPVGPSPRQPSVCTSPAARASYPASALLPMPQKKMEKTRICFSTARAQRRTTYLPTTNEPIYVCAEIAQFYCANFSFFLLPSLVSFLLPSPSLLTLVGTKNAQIMYTVQCTAIFVSPTVFNA